jgi:hypothetical protein
MIYQKRENQKFRIINRNNTITREITQQKSTFVFYYCTFKSVSSSALSIITKTKDEIKYLYDTDLRIEKNWQMKQIFSHLLKRKICLLVRIKARLLNSLDTITKN